MIKLSVDSLVLINNKIRNDILLNEPPIIVWKDNKEVGRVFNYSIDENSDLVYKPENPLPNGSTVYIEVYE